MAGRVKVMEGDREVKVVVAGKEVVAVGGVTGEVDGEAEDSTITTTEVNLFTLYLVKQNKKTF